MKTLEPSQVTWDEWIKRGVFFSSFQQDFLKNKYSPSVAVQASEIGRTISGKSHQRASFDPSESIPFWRTIHLIVMTS